jgi:hypothetical protein
MESIMMMCFSTRWRAVLLVPIPLFFNSTLANEIDPAMRANTPVPVVEYRSVFKDSPTGVEKDKVDWRSANDAVGRYKRGHIDILKEEERLEREKEKEKSIVNPAHKH